MDAERYRRRIESHLAHGRFDAALSSAALWCERDAQSLEPQLAHARVDLAADRYRAACDRARTAIRQCECPPALALHAVDCLRLLSAHDDLAAFAVGYAHWNDVPAQDRARAAGALSAIGAMPMARTLADSAVASAPDDAVCRTNRALILSYSGDFERASDDLEYAIGSPQNPAMAHWLLARLQRQTPQHNHVARLRAQLVAAGNDDPYKEYLQFALFKELDDLGDAPAAWAALDAGCALVRKRIVYDRAAQERLFAALQRQFAQPVPPARGAASPPQPIFIVGMHRSGTTLLESMLAAHPDVHAGGESQRFSAALRYAADHYFQSLLDERVVALHPSLDYDLVAQRFSSEGRRAIGKALHVTEKMPGNFQLLGFIRHALPHAKILHLRRAPMDLCFANLRELFADGVSHSYSQADVAHFHGLYAHLMQHWQRVYPGFVHDVDYEQLVTDPLGESRRVFDFCGLDWRPEVVDPAYWRARSINTLSSMQARQRVSTGSIDRWRAYAPWLEPLREALVAIGSLPAG